jgi:shikimate kinase
MGTGKSTVGRLLAARLGFEWVDTDDLIEARHGSIPQIFAGDGEAAFRALERAVALELAERSRLVISTGGRMMLDPAAAAALEQNGVVFCLTASPGHIVDRLDADPSADRPLLASDHPQRRIQDLLAERREGYERFRQVATDGRTPEEVADGVLAMLAETGP